MHDTIEADRHGIGGNLPPTDEEILRQKLTEENTALINRRDELLAAVLRVPEKVEDDEADKKLNDFMSKQLRPCLKDAEAKRVDAKQPYLDGCRNVDGFFHAVADPIEEAIATLNRRSTLYKREKAAAELAARREAERLAQAEARRLADEAAERAAAAQTQVDLDNALAAEEAALQAAADAAVATKAANAKPAEMSRTRSDRGTVSSLRTWMDIKDLDREKIDLEVLRPYLHQDDLEKAARMAVKAGRLEIRGVTIFENTANVPR